LGFSEAAFGGFANCSDGGTLILLILLSWPSAGWWDLWAVCGGNLVFFVDGGGVWKARQSLLG